MDGKSRAVQNSQAAGTSALPPYALADPAPTPDLPAINPALEINLPSFKYFTQVVQPLVFDDSLSLYEVTQKLSAHINANIEQVNALTGGVKDFMESMVKWGQEINAQWVAYQEALNKEWTDFQGEMNESYNNLVNQWNAYQADLNSQWSAYKTQVNAEMTALRGDWSQFQSHYEQLWEQYKDSIDSTIESQVNTWMAANANTTIANWLATQNIPGWNFNSIHRTTSESGSGTMAYNIAYIAWSNTLKIAILSVDLSFTNISDNFSVLFTFDDSIIPSISDMTPKGHITSVYGYTYIDDKVTRIEPVTVKNENNNLACRCGTFNSANSLYILGCGIFRIA